MEGKESKEKVWISCTLGGLQTKKRTIKLSTRKHRRYLRKDREGGRKVFERATAAVDLCTPGPLMHRLLLIDGMIAQKTSLHRNGLRSPRRRHPRPIPRHHRPLRWGRKCRAGLSSTGHVPFRHRLSLAGFPPTGKRPLYAIAPRDLGFRF